MSTIRCITINTDASFDPATKSAGFAFYVVCDQFKIHQGGNFLRQAPNNAHEAEMMCIGNAIYKVLNYENLPQKCINLVLNTDCTEAIRHITQDVTPLAQSIHQLWKQLNQRLNTSKHSMRHVKGHTRKRGGRSGANNWCDITAKQYMRAQRQQYEKR